jgi:hypothetical protein
MRFAQSLITRPSQIGVPIPGAFVSAVERCRTQLVPVSPILPDSSRKVIETKAHKNSPQSSI